MICNVFFSLGPKGSALCAYSAENTGPVGRNRGIFEIFREDLIIARNGKITQNNFFLVCQVKATVLLIFMTMSYDSVLVVDVLSLHVMKFWCLKILRNLVIFRC